MADDLIARDLDVFWHPCSQMRDYRSFPPVEIASAAGTRLRLADGRELIDAISSWWCKSLGHGHPRLRAAAVAQIDAFEHVIAANTTYPRLVRLCERLLAAANGLGVEHWGPQAAPGRRPGHFGKVFLADNGSTGVEVALKLALQAQAQLGRPRRTRFAALANGYHGETLGALSVGDLGLYKDLYRPLCFDVAMLGPLPYRSGPDDARWQDAAAEWPAIERQLDALREELAGIIVEPVLQGAGGMLLCSPDLLRRLRIWADAHDVLLIADEIAAGYGRLGAMLASHLAGAWPDVAIVAKGLTAGWVPQAAVLVTDALYDVFDADWLAMRGFLHSNTFAGNALAIAVADAVLDVYAEEDVLGRVARVGPTLRAGLAGIARARPFLRDVRGCGMMAAVDLRSADGAPLPRERRTGWRVFREAVARGALLRPLGDTIYLLPPLTVEPDEIDRLLGIVAQSVDAVAG